MVPACGERLPGRPEVPRQQESSDDPQSSRRDSVRGGGSRGGEAPMVMWEWWCSGAVLPPTPRRSRQPRSTLVEHNRSARSAVRESDVEMRHAWHLAGRCHGRTSLHLPSTAFESDLDHEDLWRVAVTHSPGMRSLPIAIEEFSSQRTVASADQSVRGVRKAVRVFATIPVTVARPFHEADGCAN